MLSTTLTFRKKELLSSVVTAVVRFRHSRGFTLTEILVTISIIAVLSVLALPILSSSTQKARQAQCVSNLRQVVLASNLYTAENNGNIVPSRLMDPNANGGDAQFWNSILLEHYNRSSNIEATRADFSCTEWEKVGDKYTNWNWGYGINDRPLYDANGPSSSNQSGRVVLDENGAVTSGSYIRRVRITNPSTRLHFACSNQWHLNQNKVGEFADGDRHGEGRCNVAFFDGHIETLPLEDVIQAVVNP